MGDVVSALERSLSKLGRDLLNYAKEWEGVEQNELEVLRAAGAAYARVMVPFLRRAAIEGVFGVAYQGKSAQKEGCQANGTNKDEADNVLDVVIQDWESWLGNAI